MGEIADLFGVAVKAIVKMSLISLLILLLIGRQFGWVAVILILLFAGSIAREYVLDPEKDDTDEEEEE